MVIALHDRNKYRGTLKVHIFQREQIEAMEKAARNVAYERCGPGASEAQIIGTTRFFKLQLMFEELKKAGFTFDGPFPKEPVDSWRNYDANGDWYELKYTQGEMAPIH